MAKNNALSLKHIASSAIIHPNSTLLANLLDYCISTRSPLAARSVHERVLKSNFIHEVFINNRLIDAYGKCFLLHEACQVFDKMPNKNTFTWNSMINALTTFKRVDEAEELF
ncbi:unnamed protein product [Cuscuta epithymum]|uniref:Pentatricopeptide repeat-containing protein n=1 Tax=Cuscuta epithymum TaxID=186058 RepID=A0AAV0CPQ3_9ASTE|nr:unnamed protein product [Cuscuta epithymum]